MRAHVVENGVIINSIEVDSLEQFPELLLVDGELGGGIGWKWVDGRAIAPTADPDVFQQAQAKAIERTYSDVDGVILAAVGNRAEEYKDAEAAARAFLDAGAEGEVDVAVSSYAQYNPTGQAQSNAWAAEQIIQRADAFRAAQKAMRAERFARQAEMRAATTQEELASAVLIWEAFIGGIVAGLGL